MKKQTVYIYGLVDPRTDEVRYIGRTNDLERRRREHFYETKIHPHLHKSKWLKQLLILKLKPRIIVLEETTEDDWEKAEKKWVSKHKRYLTNLTEGGNHSINNKRGRKLSAEHKRKISEGLLGRKHSEETKRKIGKANKGKTLGRKISLEIRKKMSKAHKSKGTGADNSMFGKPVSQKTRDKISRANKGRKLSQEHKKKISEAHKGKKHSREARIKMSEAAKKRGKGK